MMERGRRRVNTVVGFRPGGVSFGKCGAGDPRFGDLRQCKATILCQGRRARFRNTTAHLAPESEFTQWAELGPSLE